MKMDKQWINIYVQIYINSQKGEAWKNKPIFRLLWQILPSM